MNNSPDEADVLAGEFVLGLMSDAEREAFEQRLSADAVARAAVRRVREQFLELDLTAPDAGAPESLWQRVEAQVSTPSRDNVVELRRQRPGRSITTGAFWQGFAAACVLAATGFGLTWSLISAPEPRLIVVLLDNQQNPGAIVEALSDRRIRIVPLERFEVPAGKTMQVWTLPDPQTGPVSLGLLPQSVAMHLDGPSLPPPKPQQLYEITLEPAGGSPTGRPTGPILAKGFARVPQI